jgi:hypothetical protein
MLRRDVLRATGAAVATAMAGCGGAPGVGDGPPTGDGPPDGELPVRIVSRAAQPEAPVRYEAEMVTAVATAERPARLRVSLTNTAAAPRIVAEERRVQFHHVSSTDGALYLYPAGDEPWAGPVEPGCWRLTDPVAVPEYYGMIPLDAGETLTADSFVYGGADLPAGACLPEGPHGVPISGVVGDEEALPDAEGATEFTWGLSLRIGV